VFYFLDARWGGVIFFNGVRLYDLAFGFIKYDSIVHFLGSLTIVFVVYSLIHNYFYNPTKPDSKNLFLILVLMTAGAGTLIELIELIAVIFFNAGVGVGDYMNNAIDLLVNFLGALAGSLIVVLYRNKKTFGRFIDG